MTRIRLLILLFLIHVAAFADMEGDFDKAKAYIIQQKLNDQVTGSVNVNALPLTPDENPAEKTYAKNPSAISAAATEKINQPDSLGSLMRQEALTRPKISINPKAPDSEFAHKIEDNADAINDGSYSDCHQEKIQDTVYTDKTCLTGESQEFSCIKTLNVSIEQQQVEKTTSLSLAQTLHMNGSPTATVNTTISNGKITAISLALYDGSNPWWCDQSYGLQINGVTVAWYHGQCGKHLGELAFNASGLAIPFTNNAITLTLLGGGFSGSVSGSLLMSYPETEKVPVDHWVSSCVSLPENCSTQKTDCLEPNSTKIIDEIPVTRSCWKSVESMQCGVARSKECEALAIAGCSQINSVCAQQDKDFCALYQETWRCSTQETIGTGLSCGEKFYCMDGSCQATENTKNKDFGKSATELAAVNEAGKNVADQRVNPGAIPGGIQIFAGSVAECSKDAAGVDCCSESGWGKDILGSCTDQEKALGKAKERGVVVAAGGYCKHSVADICVDWRNRYCIFSNKISWDVEWYGRYQQLHRDFGSQENTDCSGLTPDELGKIDFEQIDFSNVAAEITNQKRLPSDLTNQVNEAKAIQEGASNQSPYFAKGLQHE